ncbi:MAG TPA: ATP-binding protein [Euzebya sp.]|nr:ATP-binding protein [Euzebya sp.]
MRSARTNPFQPGWGKPIVWAGRDLVVGQFTDVVLPRVTDGIKEVPRLLQDERGMGKTALLEAIADEARERDCLLVSVTAARGEDFTRVFAAALVQAAADASLLERLGDHAAAALRRLAGVQVAGTGLELRDQTADVPSTVLATSLVDVGRLARDRDRQLVILIDEVQSVGPDHLAAVFTALQRALEHTEVTQHPAGGTLRLGLPITAWLAGLPGSVASFRKAHVTFGERCELVTLGPLDDREVREALITFSRFNEEGVVFDADAIDLFVEAVAGYPYTFQLLGKAAWDAGDGLVITAEEVRQAAATIAPAMRERYSARLEGLTHEQVAYLMAAASLPDDQRTPTAVCRAWKGDPKTKAAACGGMHQRLVDDHQVIRRGPEGKIVFGLPGMAQYLGDLTF